MLTGDPESKNAFAGDPSRFTSLVGVGPKRLAFSGLIPCRVAVAWFTAASISELSEISLLVSS